MLRGARLTACVFAFCISAISAMAQSDSQDEIDPRDLRRSWIEKRERVAPAAGYMLTPAELKKHGGAFGVDLSHYTFDLDKQPAHCHSPDEYVKPECSCSTDWNVFRDSGILYVYSKATDGGGPPDNSFPRFWKELEPYHKSKQIYRGAFHFLRPGVSANAQADAFLAAIAKAGQPMPDQLPPMLDVEWSNSRIVQGTPPFKACPAARRTVDKKGRYFCDMWYKMSPAEISKLVSDWIAIVSGATGRPVIIYTNVGAWWDLYVGAAGQALAKSQAAWPSRYTSNGPVYQQSWTKLGGSPKWGMPPLPKGATYPTNDYSVANLWQFTDGGFLPKEAFLCSGKKTSKSMDMDWLPVSSDKFPALFGVNAQ